MRYRIRRLLSDGHTVGGFVVFRGKVSAVMLVECFYETPRYNPWPPVSDLESADRSSVAVEVLSKYPRIEIGGIEETPDLPDATPDWKPAWIAITKWFGAREKT
ncbi:MAG: hypothetical protein Q8O38_16655 [Sulfurimicrobium sp.]|nr:hypothetical protein [Sulfurimicrobium sp.]